MSVVADPVRRIADAVLYEGYVLWPYRRSALKNQQRFTFGGVYPAGWPEGPDRIRAECLIEGSESPRVEVRVRFLQVISRQVLDAEGEPVDELVVEGERHLSWDEAIEREIQVDQQSFERPAPTAIEIAAGEREEPLMSSAGAAGSLRRSWQRLNGRIGISRERLARGLHRLSIEVENLASADVPAPRGPYESTGRARSEVLRKTFCSTHIALRADPGEFVSLTDPPRHLAEAAAACRNEGSWPVLVGEEGCRDRMLAAPIILSDYPEVAPESPGDMFDGGEVDQLLALNIMGLTEEERAEMRASDPRTREILERIEAMGSDELMQLHGTIRERRPLT